MKRVIIESPYAGDVSLNLKYLNLVIRDSIINHNEAPFASHLMYTQALDDNIEIERDLGIIAGFEWRRVAQLTVVYIDLGITIGMTKGIENSTRCGIPVVYRELGLSEKDIKSSL